MGNTHQFCLRLKWQSSHIFTTHCPKFPTQSQLNLKGESLLFMGLQTLTGAFLCKHLALSYWGLGRNYTTSFPRSLVYRWQTVGLLSLNSPTNQSFIINLFLHICMCVCVSLLSSYFRCFRDFNWLKFFNNTLLLCLFFNYLLSIF